MKVVLLFALSLCLVLAVLGSGTVMPLRLISKTVAESTGARCLDGSPPGYYYRKGDSDKVLFFLQGGGWCYDIKDCYDRSSTGLGSSTKWEPEAHGHSLLSANSTVNPDFADFTIVHLNYCDGASFAGDLDSTVEYDGKKMWYRGHRILDVLLDDALTFLALSPSMVLLSGCSAGGLATYLHADYVHTFLSKRFSLQIYKALPISGYFLDIDNVLNKPFYGPRMKNVFEMQNCTNGVNQRCIAAQPKTDRWRCIFAQNNYPHIQAPIFIQNSFYDLWQMGNVWGVDANWGLSCLLGGPENCTKKEVQEASQFREKMIKLITSTATWTKTGNAGFLHSCWSHCGISYGKTADYFWSDVEIDHFAVRQSVGAWYFGASQIRKVGCEYTNNEPYNCNPTCRHQIF
eukprot:TRINITY_DN3585_c0_g1_i1.p1 TRINITY_DN3585_c0_g1~~TRINITY_DN3585_c0_g1_i1.p1  ORF type:complete len:413 (+),score=46.09 TRINITY_DN3585_c0_g1_i1:35-1240(+)